MIPCRVSQIIKSHRLNKAFFLTDRSLGNKLPASLLQAQRSFSSPLFFFFFFSHCHPRTVLFRACFTSPPLSLIAIRP